jgi:hypothetical protein
MSEEMRSTPLFLASLLVALSLALGLGLRPAAAAHAATPCWKSVIADWSENGSIDRSYTPACYRQAMQNAPTDLKIYSTLEDDLQSALRLRTSRRLAGASTPALTLNASHDSSSFAFLFALIGGLGAFLAACSIAAALVRRRAAR